VFGIQQVSDAALVVDAPNAYRSMVLADHPVVYVPLDETEGVIAHDLVDGGPTGTILGDVAVGNPSFSSLLGTSAGFDGSASGAIDFGDVLGFDGAAPYSIEVWFLAMSNANAYYELASKWQAPMVVNGPGNGWNLFYYKNGARLSATFAREPGAFGTESIGFDFDNVPTWHHIVGTFDGSTLRIYFDGRNLDMVTTPIQLQARAQHLYIGNGNDGETSPMFGSIDEVAIYNYELSAERIAAHYMAASP
jgi:hypothetical protein